MEAYPCKLPHQDIMIYDIEGAGEVKCKECHLQASVPHVRYLGHQVHPVRICTTLSAVRVLIIRQDVF